MTIDKSPGEIKIRYQLTFDCIPSPLSKIFFANEKSVKSSPLNEVIGICSIILLEKEVI